MPKLRPPSGGSRERREAVDAWLKKLGAKAQRREIKEQRAQKKHARKLDKYTTAKMPATWYLDEVHMFGDLFSYRSQPFTPDKCATWCKFYVRLRSKIDKGLLFTLSVYFDWEEKLNAEEETVSHVNFRVKAVDAGCVEVNDELREAARDVLHTKFAFLRYRCSMCGIDLDKVLDEAETK